VGHPPKGPPRKLSWTSDQERETICARNVLPQKSARYFQSEMAPLYQHMKDCERFLGAPYEEVNRWMDEFYATAGPKHRKFRHHWAGVHEAERLFGRDGAKAAIVHILRDCRNVPKAEDYDSGAADALGLRSAWPVSAYIHYPEEAFSALVKYTIEGPMAVVLWAFFRSKPDVANLLRGLSRLSASQQQEYLEKWEAVNARCVEMDGSSSLPSASFREVDGAIGDHLNEIKPIVAPLLNQIPGYRFAMVPVDQLITPLTLIDFEYVEELKATLASTDPKDVAAFAIPSQLNVNARAAIDPSGRSVSFISSEKTLSLTPLTISEIPGVGFEIKAAVVGTPQLILVTHVSGRLYLQSGVHRAYLLASLGVKEIPCVLAEGTQIPYVIGIYPSFAPHILASPRPPLLVDTFDPALTLLMPIARTGKIIRISSEELILPFD
jgi:hypothetical protein